MSTDAEPTLADLPFRLLERFTKPVYMARCEEHGFRELSTEALVEQVRAASLGLSALGLRPGDRVALVSDSRPEWVIADLAILTAGAVTVPVYPTLSAAQLGFILEESGARFAVVSSTAQVVKLAGLDARIAALEAVVVMDEAAACPPFRILSMADLLGLGRGALAADPSLAERYERSARRVSPTCLATIVYTSGTTGDPKGVMLTHRNIVSNVIATQAIFLMGPDDTILSFLPLSHVFERTVLYRCLYDGVTVYFAEGLTTVARDLARVKPTIITGVPRVYEKVYNALHEGIAKLPAPRRRLAQWAVGVGYERARAWLAGRPVPAWVRARHAVADRLVLSKMRARTGGNLRLLASGSAPLSAKVAEFFFAIGLTVLEGYGLTESSPVITGNPPDRPRLGTVGKPLPGIDVKIGKDGEILARGPNIMQGYYKRPAETLEAFEDGWLKTGDIGELDADGYLTITDRKKDLIVTSGGKKIAPQPLENRIKMDRLVSETVIIGERRKFPSALVVPDFARLEAWARERGLPFESREELVALPAVLERYQQTLDELNESLAQFERIKRFALLPTEFTMERGELTPTMKVRRQVVEERWRAVIEELYAYRS